MCKDVCVMRMLGNEAGILSFTMVQRSSVLRRMTLFYTKDFYSVKLLRSLFFQEYLTCIYLNSILGCSILNVV